jgi:hypothetical protein
VAAAEDAVDVATVHTRLMTGMPDVVAAKMRALADSGVNHCVSIVSLT